MRKEWPRGRIAVMRQHAERHGTRQRCFAVELRSHEMRFLRCRICTIDGFARRWLTILKVPLKVSRTGF